MTSELEQVYQHIDDHLDEHIARLQEWIRQPSVSNTGEGIRECAELTRGYFEQIGCHVTEVVEPGVTEWGAKGNPVVYAEYDAEAPKTLLVYMMYDTMPYADPPPSEWRCHPLQADIVEQPPFEQVMIGRGAVNSKGPQMAIINALFSIRDVTGTLPVNLLIVAEGDEERMSVGLRKFVMGHKIRLSQADAMLGWGGQDANGVAWPMCGSEGCLYLELETSGARWGKGPTSSPIHGMYKRTVDSPAWRHIQMLATLVDETGNEIQIDGWHDNIEQPTEADVALIEEALQYQDLETTKHNLNITGFIDGLQGQELMTEAIYGTSLNLDGIWGGLTEPGTAGSLMPHKVTSKHNCRYVPNQNSSYLLQKLRDHLNRHGYQDVKVRVIGDVPWVKANYDTPIAEAVFRMYEQFQVPYVKRPGTGVASLGPYWPAYLFADELQLPIAMGGIGHGGRFHAVDEYYVIEGNEEVHGLAGAEKGAATILYNFAS